MNVREEMHSMMWDREAYICSESLKIGKNTRGRITQRQQQKQNNIFVILKDLVINVKYLVLCYGS